MKPILKISLAASLAAAGMGVFAAPAAAQVNGIATSSPAGVVYNAQARVAAYNQIDTTYASQLQQIAQLRQEARTLSQGLDTNSDGNVSQAEADAQPNIVQQIQQKQQQIETLENPIALAQLYVIEQVLQRYNAAQTQVIQNKGIQIMLAPDAFQYGAEQADVSADIVNALNAALPSVAIAPPAEFRPRPETIQLHQTVNQLRLIAAQQAAAQRAQQGQQQQPAARQPSGR